MASDLDKFSERLCRIASIGIVITDGEFNIHTINPAAGKLLDVDCRDVTGRPVEDLMPDYRRATTRRLLGRAKELSRPVELRVLYPVGTRKRHLAITVDPIPDDGDAVQGVCLWIQDQTRRMELERRLARIDKLASLGQLAGGLAHHLNNVLGGIVTAVDHGLSEQTNFSMKRALQLVSDGLTNAVKLTRRLLEFSSPELPDQNLVDLTEAVISFVEQAQDRLHAAGRQIDLDIRSSPILAMHRFKIHQVLDCLLTNAEQALGERGGAIRIVIDSDDRDVWVYFEDNGPGIREDITDQIFEPFFTTRGTLGGGSEENLGLGLTLARRLVSEMGGTLNYRKDLSENGACFVITFPLRSGLAEDEQ